MRRVARSVSIKMRAVIIWKYTHIGLAVHALSVKNVTPKVKFFKEPTSPPKDMNTSAAKRSMVVRTS